MKTLYFNYDMQIGYAEPVGKSHFTIRCVPPKTRRQYPEGFYLLISVLLYFLKGELFMSFLMSSIINIRSDFISDSCISGVMGYLGLAMVEDLGSDDVK